MSPPMGDGPIGAITQLGLMGMKPGPDIGELLSG